jgi:hypothetical protein
VAAALSVVTIVQFPRFQAFVDGVPMIGAQLYSYAPLTSTPKATYQDPGFVTPNTNPTIMDDQGGAYVYLNGTYHLRLHDADGVLVWEVDAYAFPIAGEVGPGGILVGSNATTVTAVPGAAVISVPGLVPPGYRVRGLTSTITQAWGTSGGLTGLFLGDAVLLDRWGAPNSLALGEKTNQLQFRAGDQPIAAPSGYVVLIAAVGGLFDAVGALHLTAYYESLPVDTP